MKILNIKFIQIENRMSGMKSFSKRLLALTIPVLLLLVSNTFYAFQTKQNKTTIPMDLNMMAPNIELKINGKGPYRFDLDTGAGTSIINKKLVKELGLDVIGKTEIGSPGSEKRIMTDIVQIQQISISDHQLSEIKMMAMDLGDMLSVDGILSIKHFSDFLVTFDYPGNVIILERAELNANGENVIPYGSMMGLEIDIDGTQRTAHLDTGSPVSFAFSASFKDAMNYQSQPIEFGRAGMVGASFKIWKAQLNGEIKIADLVFESPEIILEERSGDFVTIGYQTLKDMSLSIDQTNRLLRLEKKASIRKLSSQSEEGHEFAGRYEGPRSVTFEDGQLYIQREGNVKLKLIMTENYLYKMELPDGLVPANKLPKVRFDRNDLNEVFRLTFVHEDGREEFASRKLKEK
ncbi:MAG: hypothetical protein GY863_18855 [bacterium]|nr:hypothetical protein [bacterium]